MSEHGAKTNGGYAPRLLGYVIAVIATAAPLGVAAVAAVALHAPVTSTAVGVGVFFALTLLAEFNPVPLDEDGARLVSLAFVFIVSAQILFGWQYGVLISAAALMIAQGASRTPPLRMVFNAAAYVIAAFAAALLGIATGFHGGGNAFGHLTAL